MTVTDWLGAGAGVVLLAFMWFAFRRGAGVTRRDGPAESQVPDHSGHHHHHGGGD
jgi:hypothetical protein